MLGNRSLGVLVIEDDADTRANLCDILELDGYQVETAGSMAEVRQRCGWDKISIILLDRKLPDATAEDTLPELRRLAPGAEILIVTGYRDLEGALACLHQGAADYIVKPINSEAFRANLRRVAKELRLNARLRLLDTAVRDVKEGILITDSELDRPGPKIVFANQALTQITGYTEEELLGKSPRLFQSPRTDRALLGRLKQQLSQGLPFTAEIVNRRKDGSEYFVELHVSPVFDPAGRISNYVATQRDVTARKRAEERMLQSQRLAAIGEMMAGLAHESRNALQRSKACLEMLALEVEDRPAALELIARANRAQNHLQHLYEDVRSYAAPVTLNYQTVDISTVWRDAWYELELARGGRDVTLREEIRGIELGLPLDSFAMRQVFRNIFENSLAACGEPVEIVVECLPRLLDGRSALEVSVLDNGPGLNDEQAAQIFDPFFTTKTKGTGLGMAIARRIVEAHGGRIAVGVSNTPGTRILIVLPREKP